MQEPWSPRPSARQHPSYDDCLEIKREYYQNCCVLDCVIVCVVRRLLVHRLLTDSKLLSLSTLATLHCLLCTKLILALSENSFITLAVATP